jgi:hypothetical protein
MKNKFLFVTLFFSSIGFSACPTQFEIRYFNNPHVVLQKDDFFSKIEKELGFNGYIIDNDKNVNLRTYVEVGTELDDNNKKVLLSHIKIINRKDKILFEGYKNKKVDLDEVLTEKQLLRFVKRHIKQEIPLCD